METSKRKKNILFITILSVVGLIGAMALQMIWIYNSYELIKNDLLKVSSEVFEKALREETNLACKEIPEGTEILAGPESDSIPSITYLYEGIQEEKRPRIKEDFQQQYDRAGIIVEHIESL